MVLTRRMTRKVNEGITNAVSNQRTTKPKTDQPYRQARRDYNLNTHHRLKNYHQVNKPNSTYAKQPNKDCMHIGTFNIMDARGSRLQLACRQLLQHHLDIALLTETKLNGMHTSKWDGYEIQATRCANQHQGGAAIAAKTSRFWHLEEAKRYGPNAIKTTLVHDKWRTKIIGACIPPSETDLSTTHHIDQALKNESLDRCILLGDLNVNLMKPKDHRTTQIVDSLSSYNFIDLATRFASKKCKPHCWSWRSFSGNKKIQSICDYILFGNKLNWMNFKVIDADFPTDHRLIKGKLMTVHKSRKHRTYVKKRKNHGIDLFRKNSEATPSDTLLKELQEAKSIAPTLSPEIKSWISEDAYRLARLKNRALKSNNQDEVSKIGAALRRSIRQDRRRRIWKVSMFIEERLLAGDVVGAFDVLKHWYKKHTGKTLKPSIVELETTRKVYIELFTKDENLSNELPFEFEYDGEVVDDSIPQETEIKHALFKMRSGKAPGLTEITVDDMKEWCNNAYYGNPSEEDVLL